MRRVKISLLILLGIALLAWQLTGRLRVILDDLTAHLDAVQQAAGGDAQLLYTACLAAEEYWRDMEAELIRYIPQYRVDDICSSIVRLAPLCSSEDKSELMAELSLIRHKIEELWEAHSPSITSLF